MQCQINCLPCSSMFCLQTDMKGTNLHPTVIASKNCCDLWTLCKTAPRTRIWYHWYWYQITAARLPLAPRRECRQRRNWRARGGHQLPLYTVVLAGIERGWRRFTGHSVTASNQPSEVTQTCAQVFQWLGELLVEVRTVIFLNDHKGWSCTIMSASGCGSGASPDPFTTCNLHTQLPQQDWGLGFGYVWFPVTCDIESNNHPEGPEQRQLIGLDWIDMIWRYLTWERRKQTIRQQRVHICWFRTKSPQFDLASNNSNSCLQTAERHKSCKGTQKGSMMSLLSLFAVGLCSNAERKYRRARGHGFRKASKAIQTLHVEAE